MDIISGIISQRDRALLGGDYGTYQSQAGRRIHTLRKRLGAVTPRGRKYSPKKPVTAEDIANNPEWAHLLVASAERAWASAMAMKSTQSSETTQKAMAGSTKRQIRSRLRRAVAYAENLVTVLKEKGTSHSSDRDILEAISYLAMLRASLAFEMQKWQACLGNYSTVRVIYVALGSSAKNDIYKDLLSTIVDPSMRYAAYRLKMPRTKPIPEIAIEQFPKDDDETRDLVKVLSPNAFEMSHFASTSDDKKDFPSIISWRSRQVMIEDAAISQALGQAIKMEQSINSKFTVGNSMANVKEAAASYDDIIEARQDVVDATKTAIEELAGEGVDPSDSRMQSLQVTRTAVNYAVIEWRIGRNRVLCGAQDGMLFESQRSDRPPKAKKAQKLQATKDESGGRQLSRLRERVALYDAILQSLDAVKELPGVAADSTFLEEINGKCSYFRALKCLAIGRSHIINANPTNALALFARALGLSQAAAKVDFGATAQSSHSPPKLVITKEQTADLTQHLAMMVTKYRALVELKSLSSQSQKGKVDYKPPTIERLHLYDDEVDLKNLVVYPPKLQPIPVKPLFFDLAWNYINYPGRTPDVTMNGAPDEVATAVEEKKEVKKGWFGFGR